MVEEVEEVIWSRGASMYNTTDLHAQVAEVVAPGVVTHLIAHDFGIQYGEASDDNTPTFIQKAGLYMQLLGN